MRQSISAASRKPSSSSTAMPATCAAGRLDQIGRRAQRAAGGQHVVDEEHPLARRARLPAPRSRPCRTRARTRCRWSAAATCRPCAPAPGRSRAGPRARRRAGSRAPRCRRPGRSARAARPRRSARRSTAANAAPSASSGVMSLKTIPGLREVRHVAQQRRDRSAEPPVSAHRRRGGRCGRAPGRGAGAGPPTAPWRGAAPASSGRAAARSARPVRRTAWPRPAW